MKISVELMKQYSDDGLWQLSAEELVEKIGQQLGAVEETIELGPKYAGALVVAVVECVPHGDSDHLNVCKIDDGGVAQGVERDGNGLVQVVCGAPNVRPGITVVWLPPGSTVPATFGKEPFVLGARELRGVMSNGMLASGKELDINDDHSGIIELDTNAAPGTPFAEAYSLNDTIIDIENKMFTHRPDGFGNLGVAREIAGIQGLPFVSPDWYSVHAELPQTELAAPAPLRVRNEIPSLVPRYSAVVIEGVTAGPSPLWLQTMLRRLGIRPISNIVDVTNYIMVLTGQPLHAFDYDKVAGATIVVRKPKEGEQLPLLDGRTITPGEGAMLICDAEKAIGLGGMMGGGNSEIDATTTRIVLESATFDMYTIRRTSMQHGIFTDAVTRFSKGQSPLQTVAVLAKAAEEITKLAGGKIGTAVDDVHVPAEVLQRGSVYAPVVLTEEFINVRLGTALNAEEIAVVLNNVECRVETRGDEIIVTPPFWRTDLELREDIIEEVGRLLGYDQLPHELPTRSTEAVAPEPLSELKNKVGLLMAAAGANELQTYSFVPAKLLRDVGQNPEHAFAIRNALSPELQHYRLSLTPGLLEKVHPNIKAGFSEFAIFEANKVHIKGDVDCDGLPREYQCMAFVYANNVSLPGAAYYQAKHFLEYLLEALHVPHAFVPAEKESPFEIGRQIFAPFEPKRSSYLLVGDDLEFGGFVGEYHMRARKNLKLPDYAAGFEIDLERILKHQRPTDYKSLLKFPTTEQDVCLKVEAGVQYAELHQMVTKSLGADKRLRVTVAPLDIYQREDDAAHKQITFRITLQHSERTLTTAEANDLLDAMVADVQSRTAAERI